jgi:hypothetical protein
MSNEWNAELIAKFDGDRALKEQLDEVRRTYSGLPKDWATRNRNQTMSADRRAVDRVCEASPSGSRPVRGICEEHDPATNDCDAYRVARRHSLIGVISPCGVFTGDPFVVSVSAVTVTYCVRVTPLKVEADAFSTW